MARILLVTSLFLSVLPGCGDRDDAEHTAPVTQPKLPETSAEDDGNEGLTYLDDLKRASSDDEKWRIVLRTTGWDETMAKRQIALFVETCFPTPAYAKYYPNVTKKIQLDTSCFQGILGGFGSNDKDIYDGPHSITVGEVSALWLKHLTGREFKDLAVFDAWFTANREYLKWNQEAGKFEIRRPQTFPAIGGN